MSRNPIYVKLINSNRWRTLRGAKMRTNPLCEECERLNKSTLATEVHHIIPVESVATQREMERLMYNRLNLMSVCHPCHVEIHKAAFSHAKASVQANNKRAVERFKDRYL